MRIRGRNERGFTLVELGVAILVLSLGVLAATRVGDQAQRGLAGMESRALALIVAENRAEELKLLGAVAALPDRVRMGGQEFTIEMDDAPTTGGLIKATIRVRGPLGAGAQLVAFVPVIGVGS